ncbi:MAG: hypothetical protein JHD16_09655 [Solirubrobacteraceae bacterium]|nr:hypothetical protein [Solirubrobacteraceae bacterium]
MCFSFEADLVAGAVLLPLGVATLRATTSPRQWPLASLPIIFAAHQLIESVVWLGIGTDNRVSDQLFHAAIVVYLAIAQVLLPALVPAAAWLVERDRRRRQLMLLPIGAGVMTAAWFAWSIATHDVGAHESGNALAYDTDIHIGPWITTGYILATCGAILMSSGRYLFAFGVANVIGLSLAALVAYEAVTSVWCVYAAFSSVLLLIHFRAERAGQAARSDSGDGSGAARPPARHPAPN